MSAAVVTTHVDHSIAANCTSPPTTPRSPSVVRGGRGVATHQAVPGLRCRRGRRRDRALFLIGIAGALRRSERVVLYVAHVTWTEDGPKLLVERSEMTSKAKAPKYWSFRRKG